MGSLDYSAWMSEIFQKLRGYDQAMIAKLADRLVEIHEKENSEWSKTVRKLTPEQKEKALIFMQGMVAVEDGQKKEQ